MNVRRMTSEPIMNERTDCRITVWFQADTTVGFRPRNFAMGPKSAHILRGLERGGVPEPVQSEAPGQRRASRSRYHRLAQCGLHLSPPSVTPKVTKTQVSVTFGVFITRTSAPSYLPTNTVL